MNNKTLLYTAFLLCNLLTVRAQTFTWIQSSNQAKWKITSIKAERSPSTSPVANVGGTQPIVKFNRWGACFNELGWDALNLLSVPQKTEILKNIFAPDGDLRISMGRILMNANDYARDWYSCDEVPGDFQLKYFNIDRDRTTLIPYIKAAQKFNPDMTFWTSPWLPPSWMKVNHYYSVRSDGKVNKMNPKSDVLLFEGHTERDSKLFPPVLAVNDYFIQYTRYLQAYANYFSKFITAYAGEGIPINTVMFQNESWSYTTYPGCAWTPEGIVRFNTEYLAPALKKQHPDVKVYLGTINTNRYDILDKILSDPHMPKSIQGVGFQWEGGG